EPGGSAERGLDRGPQGWIGGETGRVAEDAQRAPPIPGLGEVVKRLLKLRRQLSIGRMAVRDERVIAHAGRWRQCESPILNAQTVSGQATFPLRRGCQRQSSESMRACNSWTECTSTLV